MFREFRKTLAMTIRGGDDLHLLPVVGEFFAAVKAYDIGSRQSSGLRATRSPTYGYGEAIAIVFAPEQHIH